MATQDMKNLSDESAQLGGSVSAVGSFGADINVSPNKKKTKPDIPGFTISIGAGASPSVGEIHGSVSKEIASTRIRNIFGGN